MRWALLVMLVGCGTQTSERLQLLVGDSPVEIQAPTKILVQILVVGADGQAVTLSSSNLPAFATLSGTTMTLDTTVKDAGDYDIDLTAMTASDTATGTMHLHITRTNTAPMWLAAPYVSSGAPPVMHAPVCDMDGDNFRFEVEVHPVGEPFTNQPTYTVDVDFAVTPPLPYELPNSCVELNFDLTGLAPGTYEPHLHAVDALGLEDPYGWVTFPTFSAY